MKFTTQQLSDHPKFATLTGTAAKQSPGAVPLKLETANAVPGVKSERWFSIEIPGQIRGGKNNMIVTRSGMHFPKPEWAKWRDVTVALIKLQLPPGWKPISRPCDVHLEYVAGDKRRRDMPAILDSIFHCLEKAGVVEDDVLIWVTESTRSYDKINPMARMEFRQQKVLA
jgi:Holliday junction resolvase RusA-like endonuclease